jgi:hypothetical protein
MNPKLRLVMPMLLAVIASTVLAAPSKLEVYDPGAAGLKNISISMQTIEDEFSLEMKLVPLLEYSLSRMGYRVHREAEEADLVLVPTAGKIKVSGWVHPDGLASSIKTRENPSTKQHRERSTHPRESYSRVGLLISAYKAKDWLAMPLSGKTPQPVWRLYDSIVIPSSSRGRECDNLVENCVAQLRELHLGK